MRRPAHALAQAREECQHTLDIVGDGGALVAA
jgi:hypothetical protein